MATMDELVFIASEDSEGSIVEVEVPKKPSPPVIDIDDDEIILNVESRSQKTILAKDIIIEEEILVNMPETSQLISEPKNLQSSNPDHWTSDMIKFYNDDWGDEEQFIVEHIQNKMDKTPSLWEMSRKDILYMHNKTRYNRIKCWNCGQNGHHISMCPDPPYVPKCHMCGVEGHLESSCPNSKCLNCGNPSREYVTCCFKCRSEWSEMCSRCGVLGHHFVNCSDHWRLFHLTTGSSSVIIPEGDMNKSEKDLWCCNCGKRGHHQIKCNRRKDCGGFTDTFPFVSSYQKTFNYNNKLNAEKRRKRHRKNKKESVMRLNPMNIAINKERMQRKMSKRFKKRKKNNKREIKFHT